MVTSSPHRARYVGAALFATVLVGYGCGRQPPSEASFFDAHDFEGMTDRDFDQLEADCLFDSRSGEMVVIVGAGELAILSSDGPGGDVWANGKNCRTSAGKRIRVIEGAPDSKQELILDFYHGEFGAGTKSSPGVWVDLGGGENKMTVRGSPRDDQMSVGWNGLRLGNNRYLDVHILGVPELVVSTGPGNDSVNGMGDSEVGGPWEDGLTAYGGEGDDRLAGGVGVRSTLYGNSGDDIFLQSSVKNSDDLMEGGEGLDTVDYSQRTTPVTVTIDDDVANDGASKLEHDEVSGDIEVVIGGSANDLLLGGSRGEELYGGPGDDALMGEPNESMAGGNDYLDGGAGDDVLTGGKGNDHFVGGDGADLVSYSAREKRLMITLGDNLPDGESGEADMIANDVESVRGGKADDVITGSDQSNIIYGGPGNDVLDGRDGSDYLEGDDGNDIIRGGSGDDTLIGAAGNDRLDGGDGEDTLDGGDGSNQLICGGGDADIAIDPLGATNFDCEI